MIRALLVGDGERAEMRPIVHWIEERVPEGALRVEREICGRLSASEHRDVDLMIVLEAHPDEYSIDDVQALFAAAPLARIVCCAGSWSESAGRTRKIWPLAVRVPVNQAIQRLEREWALLTDGRIDSYLPPTGSREEWFAVHHPPLLSNFSPLAPAAGERVRERGPVTTDLPHVSVLSPDAAYRHMLTDLCERAGLTAAIDPNATAAIVLFDVDPWNPDRAAHLKRMAVSGAVIALTDWPQPEFATELHAAGAQQVLPKLGDQNQIVRAVNALMENAPLRRLRIAASHAPLTINPGDGLTSGCGSPGPSSDRGPAS